jgi:hypothetical protein
VATASKQGFKATRLAFEAKHGPEKLAAALPG